MYAAAYADIAYYFVALANAVAYSVAYAEAYYFLQLKIGVSLCLIWQLGLTDFSVLLLTKKMFRKRLFYWGNCTKKTYKR